jgi:hypothetical protein
MKAHLMFPGRDFDADAALPGHAAVLIEDLELETIVAAMAGDDEVIRRVATAALMAGPRNDADVIRYRQAAMADALRHPELMTALYDTAVRALDSRRRQWWGAASRYATSVLHGAVELLRLCLDPLSEIARLARAHGGEVESEAFRTLFAMLASELSPEYLAGIVAHLDALRFRGGVPVSVGLGPGNELTDFVLRQQQTPAGSTWQRLFTRQRPSYTLRIDSRDEAGARALGELRDRGVSLVADALADAAEHVLAFFTMLRTELAFYVGGVTLHRALANVGVPTCVPDPTLPGAGRRSFTGLRDPVLALHLQHDPVANDVDADERALIVITGANQGGKSTFLRSVGVAQLFMQCGLFVTAETFSADLCSGVFTHYKRAEDAALVSGKFDEELARMEDITQSIQPHALLLLNESFAATSAREGSEIARQVTQALIEAHVRVVFVTHLYDFAHTVFERSPDDVLFLRAERRADRQRTFKVVQGEPLQTSFGADVYDEVFGADAPAPAVAARS